MTVEALKKFEVLLLLLVLGVLAKAPPPAETCKPRLLSTFRLEGVAPEQASHSIFAQFISNKNNCCSRLDEIKIIRSVNSYTQPKLNQFADTMFTSYRRLMSLDPFLRSLDPALIRYHTTRFAVKNRFSKICYKESVFDRFALYKHQRPRTSPNNYYRIRALKIRNRLIRFIVHIVSTTGLCHPSVLSRYVLMPFSQNRRIFRILYTIRDNALVKLRAQQVEDLFLQIIGKVPRSLLHFPANLKPAELPGFVKSAFNLAARVEMEARIFTKQYNLHRVQDFTQKLNLRYLILYFVKNRMSIFRADNPLHRQSNRIIRQIVQELPRNNQLMYLLRRFITSNFTYMPQNRAALEEAHGIVLKIVRSHIEREISKSGFQTFRAMNQSLAFLRANFKLDKIFGHTFSFNTVPFYFEKINS